VFANLIQSEEDTGQLLQSNSALGRSLRRQKELLVRMGVPCEVHVRHGLVLNELLAELRRTDYDLVVSGSSPAGDKLRTYVMGNVTREIVNRTGLPVLVVRGGMQRGRGVGNLVAHLLHGPRGTSRPQTS
jgi:membrane-bound lytic murein transglycosylase MltF